MSASKIEIIDQAIEWESKGLLTTYGISRQWFIKYAQVDRLTNRELKDLGYLEDRITTHLEDLVTDYQRVMYEDQLPELSKQDYDEWFKTSTVDGVRVGKSYICIGETIIDLLEK